MQKASGFLLLLIYTFYSQAGEPEWIKTTKVVASDREKSRDEFGDSVDVAEPYAIVGTENGRAYLFERGPGKNWYEVLKTDNVRARSVAISQDRAFIGGQHKSLGIMRQADGDWNITQRFALPGDAAAISGDFAFVGSKADAYDALHKDHVSYAGAVYVFKKAKFGWKTQQKLVAGDRTEYASFGNAVAISGDFAIVGAYKDTHDARGFDEVSEAGAAYIFEHKSNGFWYQVQKLVASERESLKNFGYCVDIAGDYAIVGSRFGSGYIFKREPGGYWQQVFKSTEDEVVSVAISNDHAVMVSARHTQIYNNKQGSWAWEQRLRSAYGDGPIVALDDEYLFVGDHRDDTDANEENEISNAGAAFVYTLGTH